MWHSGSGSGLQCTFLPLKSSIELFICVILITPVGCSTAGAGAGCGSSWEGRGEGTQCCFYQGCSDTERSSVLCSRVCCVYQRCSDTEKGSVLCLKVCCVYQRCSDTGKGSVLSLKVCCVYQRCSDTEKGSVLCLKVCYAYQGCSDTGKGSVLSLKCVVFTKDAQTQGRAACFVCWSCLVRDGPVRLDCLKPRTVCRCPRKQKKYHELLLKH